MISVEHFLAVNKKDKLDKAFRQRFRGAEPGSIKADFLRGRVYCDSCHETLSTGITPKRNKGGLTRYFYYRCETPGCERRNKSVRAKLLSDFVIKYLEQHLFASQDMYERYVADAKLSLEENAKTLDSQPA